MKTVKRNDAGIITHVLKGNKFITVAAQNKIREKQAQRAELKHNGRTNNN